jgi:hypothetical protein
MLKTRTEKLGYHQYTHDMLQLNQLEITLPKPLLLMVLPTDGVDTVGDYDQDGETFL